MQHGTYPNNQQPPDIMGDGIHLPNVRSVSVFHHSAVRANKPQYDVLRYGNRPRQSA